MTRTVAILGFHKIGLRQDGRDSWFYVSESQFRGYLQWLQESCWEVIGADTFLDGLASPEVLPERAVLLTFDDGYRSMRDVALPLLRSFGFPAVLFVPTAFIGGSNGFDAGVEPEERICDWEELSALQRHAVSIQSHGVSHRRFSTLRNHEVEHELHDSRAILESRLGQAVEMISYPYGDCGTREPTWTLALERAGYKAGFLYGGGTNPVPIADVYQVERLPIGPDTDLAVELGDKEVRRKASGQTRSRR